MKRKTQKNSNKKNWPPHACELQEPRIGTQQIYFITLEKNHIAWVFLKLCQYLIKVYVQASPVPINN